MNLIKQPIQDSWGISYLTQLTDEFENLIYKAKNKIEPISNESEDYKNLNKEICFFEARVKGGEYEEVSSEYDCCGDRACVKYAKAAIRKEYGKYTHVREIYSDNDGDQEGIERCHICGRPLNEWLTWCRDELEYLEELKPYTNKIIKEEAFTIFCILQSQPTNDESISEYAKHQGGEILQQSLKRREEFFKRIQELAQAVIDAELTEE